MGWSWVETLEEVRERQAHARRMVGLRLAAVRYGLLDYHMLDRPGRQPGPRLVTSEQEWAEPTWRYGFGDATDFGVEFETQDSRFFTASWDVPGWHEGLWLREVRMAGEAFIPEATAAVWDVSQAGRWNPFVSHEITDVRMHYRPWAPEDGFWCNRVTITVNGSDIEVILGDGGADQSPAPSGDNVAVLFPPASLPPWAIDPDAASHGQGYDSSRGTG